MDYYPISIPDIIETVKKKRNYRSINRQNLSKSSSESNRNIKKIKNEFGETLVRVDGDIPYDLAVEDGQRFLFISYDQTRYSHGIHKYPAKFFPELPRWIIRRYSTDGEIVLDPFAGSGTTNIESQLNRRNSVGIDIDPFSRLLFQVKTTPLNRSAVESIVELLLEKLQRYNPSLVPIHTVPNFPYRDNWFNKEILLELTYIINTIDSLQTDNQIRNFFKMCFSSIIRAVSNADNNCTRTVVRKRLNKQIYPSLALTKFAESILINSLRIIEYSRVVNRRYTIELSQNSDARSIGYPDSYFDLAVTSPPYVNAVDYPRTHQLEIYWLGICQGSLTPLKRLHVGTESVLKDAYNHLHEIGDPLADEVIRVIFEKDRRRAYIAYKYLYDMRKNLEEVYRVLKKNRHYVIVVGNNTIRGQQFESWKYLMHLSEKVGFKVKNYFGSEIIKHFIKVPREERINTDWIIVLEK